MIFNLYAAKWCYSNQAEVMRLARLGFRFVYKQRETFTTPPRIIRTWIVDEQRLPSIEIKSFDDLMALVHDWPNEGVVVNNDTITIYNDYLE